MMNKNLVKKISLFRKQLILLMNYGKKINFSSKQDKGRIIICFDGLFSHGGLVDRLKGIVSFYEVAKILDYDFYIYFNHPFKLIHFLKPNKINWEIDDNQIVFNPFTTKIFYLMNNLDVNPIELIKKSKSKTILVYTNLDYLTTIHKENSIKENQKLWRDNYNELFETSDDFKKEINKLPIDKRIVFHTRFTSLMGDFMDTSSEILDESNKQILINNLISKIEEVALSYPYRKIYVLSDSIVFLEYIRKHTPFYVLEGNPKHIDVKNNESDLESHSKAFLDFYFMSKSDEIYLLKLDKMYSSGFSKYASIVGDTKFTIVQ